MSSPDPQQVQILVLDSDDGDSSVVVLDTRFTRGITEDDPTEALAFRGDILTAQPGGLDHVAVGRRRVLLVLGGKDAATQVPLQLV